MHLSCQCAGAAHTLQRAAPLLCFESAVDGSAQSHAWSVGAGELAEQLQAGTGIFGSPGVLDDDELDDELLAAAAEAAEPSPPAKRGRGRGYRGGRHALIVCAVVLGSAPPLAVRMVTARITVRHLLHGQALSV